MRERCRGHYRKRFSQTTGRETGTSARMCRLPQSASASLHDGLGEVNMWSTLDRGPSGPTLADLTTSRPGWERPLQGSRLRTIGLERQTMFDESAGGLPCST